MSLRLTGTYVSLEPLSVDHAAGLLLAANEDRRAYGWTAVPSTVDEMDAFVASARAAFEQGHQVPFAVRRVADGHLVGSTRFLNIERWERGVGGSGQPDSAEIGSTWYSGSAQRSAVNTEAKLLLLTYAFETWQVQRLQLKTDARNARSRAAIERLGARFEGELRHYQPGLGPLGAVTGVRDTAMYSILPAEWPEVKARLVERLGGGTLSRTGAVERQDR